MLYQLSYWPTSLRATPGEPGWLPGFPMQRVRTAVPTKLLVLDAIGVQPPVLVCGIVAPIALTAGQSDEVPGHMIPRPSPNTKLEPTTGLEPVTSSLPRRCSTC